MNRNNRHFKTYIVLFLILGVLGLSLTPKLSYAQSATEALTKAVSKVISGCSLTGLGGTTYSFVANPLVCVAYFISLFGWIGLEIVEFFTGINSFIFNAFLGLTIDDANYSPAKVPGLGEGWTFSRDLVNIFFIFILLFIAIATILQIESYGAKQLLVRLIIIALLVNFSFFITQEIIMISNSLTVTLYQRIPADETFSRFLGLTFQKDIGEAVIDAFSPQVLLKKVVVHSGTVLGGLSDALKVLLGVILIELVGIILLFAISFILLVAAFFFVVRMGILWFLLILAPFGFVFLILPATKGYALTWWRKLGEQAIFAPTFLFFLTMFVIIVRSFGKFFEKATITSAPAADFADAIRQISEFLALMSMQTVLAFIFLLAALIVSKQMGIYGANTAISWAGQAGKWGRARALGVPRRVGGRYAQAFARGEAPEGAGYIMRGFATAGRGMRQVPVIGGVVTGTAAYTAAANRRRIEELRKQSEKYSSPELRSQSAGAQGFNLVAEVQELAKRGDIELTQGLTEAKLRQAHRLMQLHGINPRDLERLWPELRATPQQVGVLRAITPRDRLAQLTARAGPMHEIREAAGRIRPEDAMKIDESIRNQEHTMEAIAASLSSGTAQRFAERRDMHEPLIEALRRLASAQTGVAPAAVSRTEVVATLKALGNESFANWLERTPAGNAFF